MPPPESTNTPAAPEVTNPHAVGVPNVAAASTPTEVEVPSAPITSPPPVIGVPNALITSTAHVVAVPNAPANASRSIVEVPDPPARQSGANFGEFESRLLLKADRPTFLTYNPVDERVEGYSSSNNLIHSTQGILGVIGDLFPLVPDTSWQSQTGTWSILDVGDRFELRHATLGLVSRSSIGTSPDAVTWPLAAGFSGAPPTFAEVTREKTTGELAVNVLTGQLFTNGEGDTTPEWKATALTPEQVTSLLGNSIAAETAARIAAIEALQQIPIVLIASGNEFRPDTDFGKLLSIDGSTNYLYLPEGDANDVGKRLWITSVNGSFLFDYSDLESYGQTTPGVLYMAVATSFASGSLRWKVSLDQTNVNLTGIQTIGGTKTFSSAPRSSGALSGNANEIPNISQIYAMLVDPDNIIIREEMLSLANWSNASSGTGFIDLRGSAQNNSGSFQINSGATLGGRGVAAFAGPNFWPQQHNSWRAVFIFTLNTIPNVRIRVGFSLNPTALWTSMFTGISYDSSLSPNLRFVNDSGSSPEFTDTGVAAAIGSFKLTMRGSSNGQIYISINDGAETLITGGLTFGVRSIFGIENLATGSARFEADFFSYFGTLNR